MTKKAKTLASASPTATPAWLRAEDKNAWHGLRDDQRAQADRQHAIYDDGAPLWLIVLTPEDRTEAWRASPPRASALFTEPTRAEDPSVTRYKDEQAALAEAKQQRSAVTGASAAKREPTTPRASREGMISVATLAAEYGMIPRVARAALRAAKVAKPSQGWAFVPGSDLEKQIRAALVAAKNAAPKEGRRTRDGVSHQVIARKAPAIPPASETTWSGSKKDRARWQKQQHTSSSNGQTVSTPSKAPLKAPSKTSKKSTTKRASPPPSKKSSTRSAKSSSKKRK